MSTDRRIAVVYRRDKCQAEAKQLLGILDRRYPERRVLDVAFDDEALATVVSHLTPSDVMLVLVDSDWDRWRDDEKVGRASTMRVAVASTWDDDVKKLLGNLDLQLGDRDTLAAGHTEDESDELTTEIDVEFITIGEARTETSERYEELQVELVQARALVAAGDVEGARASYDALIRSDETEYVARAGIELGQFLEDKDLSGARDAYRAAVDVHHPAVSPAAAFLLAVLDEQRGHFDEAEQAFQKAITAGDDAIALRARLFLGRLYERRARPTEARLQYAAVLDRDADSGLRRNAEKALARLG